VPESTIIGEISQHLYLGSGYLVSRLEAEKLSGIVCLQAQYHQNNAF